jgi:hypothetical protein
MTAEILLDTTSIDNIIATLQEVGKKSYEYGPEGVYNEYSLVNELINHLLEKPKISKDEWYMHYEFWLKFVKEDIRSIDDLEYEEYWDKYIEKFLDRMEVIEAFAEIILR